MDSQVSIQTAISSLFQPVRTFKNPIHLSQEKHSLLIAKWWELNERLLRGSLCKIFSTPSAKFTPPPPRHLPVSQDIGVFQAMLSSRPF